MTGCQRVGLRLRAAVCVERCDRSELAPDRGARLIKGAGQAPDQLQGRMWCRGIKWWWAGRMPGLQRRQAQHPVKRAQDKPRHNSSLEWGEQVTTLCSCVSESTRG